MRRSTDQLVEVLSASFSRRLYVDVFHGTDRQVEDLPFESWSLSSSLSAGVQSSGSGTVVYSSADGESLVPDGTQGVLSPFRARLSLVMEITAGGFSERIQLGMFQVVRVPEAQDFFADVAGMRRVVASRVKLEFVSLDNVWKRRGFRFPEKASSLSCYAELRRITGFPVAETVPDKGIPSGTVWEAKQGGRLEAVQYLAGVLGGTATVNSVGQLRVVPDTIGSPSGFLELGSDGTVVDVGADVDTDDVCNAVVGVFEDANRNPIYSIAQVTDGPLAVNGPYGEYTRYYSSDFVKTQVQADSAVRSILNLSIGSQLYDVQVQCHFNPLIELGDVVELKGWVRKVVGRVVEVRLSDSHLMNVTLEVARELS